MAELLVWAKAEKRTPDDFEPGDVIAIYPDGQLGPYAHCNGKFAVIKVPGTKREDLEYLLESPETEEGKEMLVPRIERIDIKALSKSAADGLAKSDKTATLKSVSDLKTKKADEWRQ